MDRIADGILIAHLINLIHADTVDFRALNIPTSDGYLPDEKKIENQKGINLNAVRVSTASLTPVLVPGFGIGRTGVRAVLTCTIYFVQRNMLCI